MRVSEKQEAINTFWEKMAINLIWRDTNKLSKTVFAKNQEAFADEFANTCIDIGRQEACEKLSATMGMGIGLDTTEIERTCENCGHTGTGFQNYHDQGVGIHDADAVCPKCGCPE